MKKIVFATALLVALSAYAVPAPPTAPEWASNDSIVPHYGDESGAQPTPLPDGRGERVGLLQEIQVTSTRAGSRTPMAVKELSREQIQAVNHGRDVPFLLSLTPSVTTTTDAGAGVGYTSFRVRGTDPSRINITANGVPLNDGESSLVYFSNMGDFASSVQSIQIQRGVGTSTNGAGAFGATVNMLTDRIDAKPYVGLDASAGSYATHKETLRFGTGLIGGRFGLQGRLSNIGSNGYIDRATSSLNSYFLQAGWFGDNSSVKLITFNGTEKTYMAWNYTSKYEQSLYGRTFNSCGLYYGKNDEMCFYDNQYDKYRQQHYQLHWNQQIGTRWTTNVALHYTHDGYDYDQMKQNKKLYKWGLTESSELRGNLVQRKGGKKDFFGLVASANYKNFRGLEVNLGGAVNRFNSKHDGTVLWVARPLYNEVDDVLDMYANLAPDQPYYHTASHKTDANLYAKATWEIVRGLSLFGDIQFRHIKYVLAGTLDEWADGHQQAIDINKNFNFLNPKVGVNYEFLRHHRLYASYAIAHREPTRDHYQEHYGEDVRPERLGDLEVGYKFQSRRFTAGVNFYHMHYKDQFVLTGELDDEGVAVTKNIPKSYRMGVELEAAWQPADWFRWDANATLSRNRAKDMVVTLDDYVTKVNIGETPLSFSPNFMFNNILTFSYKGARASIHSKYVGQQYLTNYGVKTMTAWSDWTPTDDTKTTETLMLAAHFTTDVDLSYTLPLKKSMVKVPSITLGITLYNIFNAKYDNNGWAAPQFRQNADGSVYAVNTWGLRDYDAAGFAPSAPFNFLGYISINF
ncbi:MAG: TonB-dependent receptor [Bacteroidaceae bacterium]|nr:TonB-dependent receptor [Bacteroidaceae bacterium]